MKFVLKPNNQNASNDELLEDLKKVALSLNKETLLAREYDESKLNRFYSGTISKRIGSWNKALKKVGLKTTVEYGMPDKELFDNIQHVWIGLGRQPNRREMKRPISKYSESPYVKRWGSWYKGLEAFVEYINSDKTEEEAEEPENVIHKEEPAFKHKTKRNPSERLKVLILMRDGNKCKLCGKTLVGDEIHFDHVKAWSKGGETTLDNLQILCAQHNLAKGNAEYPENKNA